MPRKHKSPTKPKSKKSSEGIAPTVRVSEEPKPKPEGYVFGRPTLYHPSYCEKVIEWGRLGKSITWMAAELNITKVTIYEWINVHQDFSNAIERARVLCQQWWEDAGQKGMEADKFNSAVWAKNMAARFRDEWTDRQELTGAGGSALVPVINVTTTGTT